MTADTTRMPRRRVGFLVAGIVLVAVIAYASRGLLMGKAVETFVAERGSVVQTVVASGNVTTPGRQSVGAEITGHVARIPVAEGQTVKRGQVLIALDDKDERAAADMARAAVQQAEAKLRQLRDVALPLADQGLRQAKANALQSRQQFERTKALQARGFVGQAQLDDAQRNLDVAESQLRAAQLQAETSAPGGSDYVLAKTALDQAKANLQVNQAKLGHTVIHAPVDGTLIARSVEVGDIVQPGKELMKLAPTGEAQIVVQIDEKNLARLAVGQKALGMADAYPSRQFAAEVVYINPAVDPQRGSVMVKLKVPQPPDYLRQDMTVSVDIEVGRRAEALTVPPQVVHDLTGAEPWVMVIRDGQAARQPVRLGLRGNARVEVLDGIAAGEALITATDGTVSVGQRVRATPARANGR